MNLGNFQGISPKVFSFAIFPVLLSGMNGAWAEVQPYAPLWGEEISDFYRVEVDGKPLTVSGGWKNQYICRFGMSGEVTVNITPQDESIGGFSILPKRHGIKAKIEEKTLVFNLKEPVNLRVYINEKFPLHLIAQPFPKAEDTTGENIHNVVEKYAVDNTGGSNTTASLQSAIDDISQNGGGTAYLPNGTYLGSETAELFVKSNTTLFLAPEALVRQMRVVVNDAENVEITGHGVLDFTGGQGGNQDGYLRANNVNDLRISDVFSIGTDYNWNTRFDYCQNVDIRNYKVFSGKDGIDPVNSSHVLMENLHVFSTDDCLAIKSFSPGVAVVEDIIAQDALLQCFKYGAAKIGTETNAGQFRDITYRNMEVVAAMRPIIIQLRDGARISNVTFENFRIDLGWKYAVAFLIEERKGLGTMKNIKVKNFNSVISAGGLVTGYDDAHQIDGVVFEDMYLNGGLITKAEQTGFTISHAKNLEFTANQPVHRRIENLEGFVSEKSPQWQVEGESKFSNLFVNEEDSRSSTNQDTWIVFDFSGEKNIAGIQVRRNRRGVMGYSMDIRQSDGWVRVVDHQQTPYDHGLHETRIAPEQTSQVRVLFHSRPGSNQITVGGLHILESESSTGWMNAGPERERRNAEKFTPLLKDINGVSFPGKKQDLFRANGELLLPSPTP